MPNRQRKLSLGRKNCAGRRKQSQPAKESGLDSLAETEVIDTRRIILRARRQRRATICRSLYRSRFFREARGRPSNLWLAGYRPTDRRSVRRACRFASDSIDDSLSTRHCSSRREWKLKIEKGSEAVTNVGDTLPRCYRSRCCLCSLAAARNLRIPRSRVNTTPATKRHTVTEVHSATRTIAHWITP